MHADRIHVTAEGQPGTEVQSTTLRYGECAGERMATARGTHFPELIDR